MTTFYDCHRAIRILSWKPTYSLINDTLFLWFHRLLQFVLHIKDTDYFILTFFKKKVIRKYKDKYNWRATLQAFTSNFSGLKISPHLGDRCRPSRGKRSRPKSISWPTAPIRRRATSTRAATPAPPLLCPYRASVPADSNHFRTLHLSVSIFFYVLSTLSFMRLSFFNSKFIHDADTVNLKMASV